VVQQEPTRIDFVFWVPTESGCAWRSWHDLPQAGKTLFMKKFQQDYLNTIPRANYFDTMVRHKHNKVKQNKCVAEELGRYGKNDMKMDRKTSCDSCTSKSRFCARLVNIGYGVKLGFLPVHGVDGSDVAWDRLDFWIAV
jgi:hypothetical protein